MQKLTPEQNFERILLKSILTEKSLFSKVFSILKSKYFTQERREIFNLITQHYKEFHYPASLQDIEISIKNVGSQERRTSIFAELNSLNTLNLEVSSEKLCEETLRFVKDALYLEALEVGSEGLVTKNDELKKKAERILDERAKVNIDSDVGIEFSDSSAVIDYYGQETHGLITQHYSLNDRLGPGFLPGTLSVILAPSGVGKSLLMTDLISGYVKQGKNVLLVSLEMSSQEVMKRVHSNVLEMPIADFVPKHFDKLKFIKKLTDAKSKGCGTFWAKDYPAQSFSALQLENLVETFKNEKNLEFDVIFIDYLGIMKSDLLSPSAGLYSYVKSIAEEVRATAKKLKKPIISASQLNRGATNNTQADNAAVSDSMGTVMTADFMLFLLQTEEMKSSGDIIFKITKNRFSGKTETFPMRVDYELMRFEDPEIPKSLEARKEFKEKFDFQATQTEELIKEDHFNNMQAVKKHDSNNSSIDLSQELEDVWNSL